MPLTIEDGTGIANADSYVTLVEARAYATKYGFTLPADDTELEQLLCKATIYLETRRHEYLGSKTTTIQALQFPRTGVKIDCQDLDANTIPQVLKNAQIQLAVEQQAGVPLFPSPITSATSTAGQVTEKTVGPLTFKYSDKSTAASVSAADPEEGIKIASVETLLQALFRDGCGSNALLSSIRI